MKTGIADKARGMVLTRLDRSSGQVEPLLLAFAQFEDSDPFENGSFVAPYIENRIGGSTVQEMNAAHGPFPFEKKAPNSVTRNARQMIVATREREADEFDEFLPATHQMPAQAQQTLAMIAKSVKPDGHVSTVRPENFVAFERNLPAQAISGWIPPKENGQVSRHPGALFREKIK